MLTKLCAPALACLMFLVCFLAAFPSPGEAARVTLLIPSKASVESSLPVVSAKENEDVGHGEEKGDKAQQIASHDKDKKSAKESAPAGKKQPASASRNAGKKEGEGSRGSGASSNGTMDAPKDSELVDAVNASILASIAPQQLKEEVDLLFFGMDSFRHRGIAMDPPRIFTIYRFDRDAENPLAPAKREDRLGDIEETRYLNQKAWGANVGLDRPGLYQFVIETQPWWSQQEAGYARHIVKTMLPVYGEDWGWDIPLGLSFEIVPLTRPFGLFSPSLLAGRVLVNGKPEQNVSLRVCRINTENLAAPTQWHEEMALKTAADGTFAVVLNRAGWWCCIATREGAPLKGPDGQPSPLLESTLLWLYVDAPEN